MSNNELFEKIKVFNNEHNEYIPSKQEIELFADELLDFLFPLRARFSNAAPFSDLKHTLLFKKLEILLSPFAEKNNFDASALSTQFFQNLSPVFDLLLLDAEAIQRFDPAANSVEEVITAYPGFYAVSLYRISHILYNLGIPAIPRIISEHAHSKTGIDIHPGATIGKSFFIDHGTGVVIGETTLIGDNVKIYQGVTLGALQVSKAQAQKKRHPTIEDNVMIYSGATILGGDTLIGHDSVIGGNVWLTASVPSFSLVFATHEVKVRNSKEFVEPIDFVI
ncbi:MAG: serine O-acetyltransferase EpsC [Chitinophagales bacterium]